MLYQGSKPRSYVITPTRRKMCRPLIRRNYRSFAATAIRNHLTRNALLNHFGQMLQNEVSSLCSSRAQSVIGRSPKNVLLDFRGTIDTLMVDMRTRAPTLLSLLKHASRTRRPRVGTNLIIAMIVSLLCKHRKSNVCQLQRIISLILYTGHSSKQVIYF